jgi:hypothetical protein
MQISKFFGFFLFLIFIFAWACLVWEGMVLRDLWKQEAPVSHGLQRTLGPWNQDPTAYADARRQQFTTKASSETPEWTEAGLWVRRPLCRKLGGSQQPLLCSLSKVSWPLWCFLRQHDPEEATSNRSEQFATNSLRGGQGTLVFYKFLIFFKQGLTPWPFFVVLWPQNFNQESLCLHEMTI